MTVVVPPARLVGSVRAIPSKSHMHRALICASLADRPTDLLCPETNRDIEATVGCLRALGAEIVEQNGVCTVRPIAAEERRPQPSIPSPSRVVFTFLYKVFPPAQSMRRTELEPISMIACII